MKNKATQNKHLQNKHLQNKHLQNTTNKYKIYIYVKQIHQTQNTQNVILENPIFFNVCEKNTIERLLKLCNIKNLKKENYKLKIMWSFFNNKTKKIITGWDNLYTDNNNNFKNIMSIEHLNDFYDGLYNYNNIVFLEILK
tara:strand:+ start:2625 stop:3044 length:420 start_codon:yes stop_codon:yes gene_type:complete